MIRRLISVLFFDLLIAGVACSQQVYYTGSALYATGNYYFAEHTNSFGLNNGLSVTVKRLNISVNVPFVAQSTPWISYSTTGLIPTGGPQHLQMGSGSGMMGKGSRSGIQLADTGAYTSASFGDPSLHAGYELIDGGYTGPSFHINAALKFPLASQTRGFGTGTWDAGIGGAADYPLGSLHLNLSLMYWWLGDLQDLHLNNILAYNASFNQLVGGGDWSILGGVMGSTTVIDGFDAPLSVDAGLMYRVSQNTGIMSMTSVGVTNSSPDFTLSLGWNIRL